MERPAYRSEDEREYKARGWWRDDDTLWHWLRKHAAERPDAPAILWAGGQLSWRRLEGRVLRVAAGLYRKGIGAGDVVAIQLPNTPEFLIVHLAIARLGAVMCTVHMPYRGAEIESILAHSGAKLFFTGALPFSEFEDPEPLPASHPAPDARDPFLVLYTSGTTASPKAVPHAYRTMLGNSRLGAAEHLLSAQSRVLCAAPLSHLYGLYSLHCAWSVGACTLLLPAFKPDELAQAVQSHRPTALWTAPAHVAACRNAGLFDTHDWSSLKLAIVSGSMAPPPLVRTFAEKLPGCAVTQLWGMTELQAALYTRPGDGTEAAATSAGRPSPGTQVRVSDEGELQVKGPLTFSGYYDNEEANATAFTADGWFRSGDLAERRGEYYAITGRIKDVINRGGVKFNPADVEALLDAHPKVLQSAIVPMPDPVLGEKACAFVVLKKNEDRLSLEEIVEYLLSRQIAKNKLPERLVVVPEMPLTPTRKIIKGRLRIPEQA
ncbi:MAG TPA: class I adenylate-forming enzyme family protein [Burkholderiales bacterium]|nr:class I adenylate-forming enzyme family protein [Burkholderiales bacterium]